VKIQILRADLRVPPPPPVFTTTVSGGR